MRLEKLVDPFQLLVEARREELKGWCQVAAYLAAFKQHKVKWWEGIADTQRTKALQAP